MKTKYTARFDHVIKASDLIKGSSISISEASRKELKQFVPYIDCSNGNDLLGLAFDIALVNVFNLNGDGISSAGAVKMLNSLIHKPINIEHDRSTVVGHILNGTLTDSVFKKSLSAEDVAETLEPFNITLGGVIYKVVAGELASLLMDIQEGKKNDFSIASSWEVGFDSFFAAVGGKYLGNCRVIKDEAEIEKLSKYMKCYGGKGLTPEGEPVNRLIDPDGTIVFLGAGLTRYPAADVGGVYAFDYYDYEDERGDETEPVCGDADKDEKDKSCISHLNKANVLSLRTEQIMEKEELIKLIGETVKASIDPKSELSLESIASVTSKIADAIVESNKTFVAEKESAVVKAQEAEAKAKEQAEKVEVLEKKLSDTAEVLAKANEKLGKIEEEARAAAEKEKFNERMAAIDSKFNLNEKDREIIAKQISAVATDEEFASLEQNLTVLMSEKLKTKIQEIEASEAEKVKNAVAEELKKRGITDPFEAKANEGEGKTDIANNSAEASKKELSTREKLSKAFDKKTIKVTI